MHDKLRFDEEKERIERDTGDENESQGREEKAPVQEPKEPSEKCCRNSSIHPRPAQKKNASPYKGLQQL